MFMTGISGIIPGTNATAVGSSDIAVTLVDQDSDVGSSSSSKTFSGIAFGAEAVDRRIIVVAPSQTGSAHSINTMTIGGVSAVKHCEATGGSQISIWSALVPTGITGNIVLNYSVSIIDVMIVFVYRLIGTGNVIPDFTATAGSNVGSVTIDHNANSVTIGGGVDASTDNVPAHTMTGVDHDAVEFRGGDTAACSGHKVNAGAGSIVVSMNNVEGATDKFAALSWT